MTGPGRILLAAPGRSAQAPPPLPRRRRRRRLPRLQARLRSRPDRLQQLRQLAGARAAIQPLAPFAREPPLAEPIRLPGVDGLGDRRADRGLVVRIGDPGRAGVAQQRRRVALGRHERERSAAPRPGTRRPCPRRPRGPRPPARGTSSSRTSAARIAASASACGRKPSSASASPRPRPSAHSRSAGPQLAQERRLHAARAAPGAPPALPRTRPGTAAACAGRRTSPAWTMRMRSPRAYTSPSNSSKSQPLATTRTVVPGGRERGGLVGDRGRHGAHRGDAAQRAPRDALLDRALGAHAAPLVAPVRVREPGVAEVGHVAARPCAARSRPR